MAGQRGGWCWTPGSRSDSLGAMSEEDADERVQVPLRLPRRLVRRMDERAKRFGMSRNAWAVLALTRLVDMPSQVTQRQERF